MTTELIDYLWRAARREDGPAIHALLTAADQADDRTQAGALEDLISELDDPWSLPETDMRLVFAADGALAGMARAYCNPAPDDDAYSDLMYEVHPAHRGRGLEDALLNWLEAHAGQRLQAVVEAVGPRRRSLRIYAPPRLAERVAHFEAHGFKPLRNFYHMRRDLSQPIPPGPALPDGLTVSAYHPGLDEAARDAFNDSFRDEWSFEKASPEDWQMFIVGQSAFRPDLTRLLLDGSQVAGFAMNQVRMAGHNPNGVAEGHVDKLGVRRAWRKRGLGRLLLARSLAAFRDDGLAHATLGVDAENRSGALRLYQSMGFETDKHTVVYEKLSEE